MKYLLYHTKLQGYVLRSGTYGTNVKDARLFNEEEVVAFAQRALPSEGMSPLLPVPLSLLNSIRPTGV